MLKNKGIVEKTKEELTPSEEGKGHALTLNVEMVGALINNLTNLYTDPKAGSFRETLSNAIDSHYNLAKNTKDFVEVTLPKYSSSIIVFKDYGVGMSRETLIANFLSYGSSTKLDSRKETGGFGYGGKSPLAVCDSFSVTSVKDGLRNSFVVSKNIDDTMEPPKFEWDADCETSPAKTEEPDGVVVTYHMPPEFTIEYGQRVREEWTPKPIQLLGVPLNTVKVDGTLITETVHNSEIFKPVSYEHDLVGWTAEEYEDKEMKKGVYVHIGNVIYPVKSTPFSSFYLQEQLSSWKTVVILNAEKGTLDITPSRDELRYSERTVETLKGLMNRYTASLEVSTQVRISQEEGLLGAIALYTSLRAEGFPWQETTKPFYRDQGELREILEKVREILSVDYRSANPGINYLYLLTSSYNSRSSASELRIGSPDMSWSAFFSKAVKFPLLVSNSTELKVGTRIRRNWELLSKFGKQKDKFLAREISQNVIVIKSSVFNENPIIANIFKDAEDLETALKSARSERTVHNKIHGISPRPRVVRPRLNKISFVTIETDTENSQKYIITPHVSVTEGRAVGKHIRYSVGDNCEPIFSVSNFDSDSVTGDIENLDKTLRLALSYGEENNVKVVVRKSRQADITFPEEVSFSPAERREYALTKAVPPPILSIEEIRTRLILGEKNSTKWSRARPSDYEIYKNLCMSIKFKASMRSFGESLDSFSLVASENEIDMPEDLKNILDIKATAETIINNSPLKEWLDFRDSDSSTTHIYHDRYVIYDEYVKIHSDNIDILLDELEAIIDKYRLLFLATSLLSPKNGDTLDEAEKALLVKQISAIAEVLK